MNVENAVQLHLEQALVGVLEDQAKAKLTAIEAALDAWEFEQAIKMGADLSAWAVQHGERLSNETQRRLYQLLARVEILKATRAREEHAPLDLSRAEHYFARAKEVADR